MKTNCTPNWRPLPRALSTILLGAATLWAMPRSADAQLYVGQTAAGIVSEYNATTGAPMSPNFITGGQQVLGLAVSGNILYVADADAGTIGKYNATTGAVINANFITGLIPSALVVSGNILFVTTHPTTNSSASSDTVGEYRP